MLKVLKSTFQNWIKDDPFTQSAAAAYYSIFSMPGLLIIVMALAALFFDQQQVEQQILGQIKSSMGAETAETIREVVNETQRKDRDIWGLIVGIATLAFGATGLFAHLQRSLNQIWGVEIKKSAGWFKLVKDRLISFSLVLVIGFLLLVSLSLTSALAIFKEWLAGHLSEGMLLLLIPINIAISLSLVVILFALIYKILPDVDVPWSSAFGGAVLSALLFTLGEHAIGLYFGIAEPQSSFGAAGSIILIMLWVSYSCMIVLIGAEFSKAYTLHRKGMKALASDIA